MSAPFVPVKNKFQRYFGVATLESAETTLEFFVGMDNYWRGEKLPESVFQKIEESGFDPARLDYLNLFIINGIGYTILRFDHDGDTYGVILNRRVNPVTLALEWRVWNGWREMCGHVYN